MSAREIIRHISATADPRRSRRVTALPLSIANILISSAVWIVDPTMEKPAASTPMLRSARTL
jgi:hypothetical protein